MNLSLHQKKTYQDQDRVLTIFKGRRSFPYVLSGGTALSRFYLHHRFSEDLDFFCDEWTFSLPKIAGIINSLRQADWTCELTGTTDAPHLLKVASYVVRWKKNRPLKIDFLEDPFSGMWNPVNRPTESGVHFRVDALDQIYYRKLFVLMERASRSNKTVRIKDLVDIYYLHTKHQNLLKTIAYLRKNHVPIQEEKIIMVLCNLKKPDLKQGLKDLSVDVSTDEVWQTLRSTGHKLLQEGLKK